jgi:N6-adenosine-specific RNA methylase IME4/ParB-like chromosome segregation protein Spo0J
VKARELPVDDIIVPRGRRLRGDVGPLAASIAAVGLLHPVTVTPDGRLVAGLHRLAAVRTLGWTKVPVLVADLNGLEREIATIDENVVRVDLPVLERAEALARRKKLYEALHPEARRGAAGGHGKARARRGEPASDTRSVAAQVASRAGVSTRTIERQIRIAERIPEDLRRRLRGTPLEDDQAALLRVAKMTLEHQEIVVGAIAEGRASSLSGAMAQAARLSSPPLPRGTYRTIVMDPPWPYESAKTPYPAMSLDELKALPVPRLLGDEGFVWLWTTNAMIEEAFACVRAWGLVPKTMLTWAKDRPGTGHWLMGQTEHAVLAVRGSPRLTAVGATTLLQAPTRNHSEKPQAFYDLVERMCPGPRLDMFARGRRKGWTSWGSEAEANVVPISMATPRHR